MSLDTKKNSVRAATLIADADALIITAGAGMGVDSGLPDFRGNEGFWKAYPALGSARIDFTSIASPSAFAANPKLAWGFYGHRLALYRRTVPHHGFNLLKHWGAMMQNGVSVFTSNVDGQFQLAGFNPAHINECHGSIHHLQCMTPCSESIWSADDFLPDVDEDACLLQNPFPQCPHCGGMARPNVLMFGDWSWIPNRQEAQAGRQAKWLSSAKKPVVIELGAGTAIPSVRNFSESVTRRLGGQLIRINLREPDVNNKEDVGLAMGALDGLNAIASLLGTKWQQEPSPVNCRESVDSPQEPHAHAHKADDRNASRPPEKEMSNELATSKDTLIRSLVSYDVEYFVAFIRTSDAAKIALATMMMEGFVGYNHWSEEELRKECVRRELL